MADEDFVGNVLHGEQELYSDAQHNVAEEQGHDAATYKILDDWSDVVEYNNQLVESNAMQWLRLAAERVSQSRYVFLVQIEDGIPAAEQRAALEYADAVLIGWPDSDQEDVQIPDEAGLGKIEYHAQLLEQFIAQFRNAERLNDLEVMTESLIRIADHVAGIRKEYQPEFLLPTFAEIRRVVEDEWKEDMEHLGDTSLLDTTKMVGTGSSENM